MNLGLLLHRYSRALSMLCAGGLVFWAGCSDGGVSDVTVSHPTLVSVSPETFLGDVPCGQPGGLQTYVATLKDVTAHEQALGGSGGSGGSVAVQPSDVGEGGDGAIALPSSGPIPCLSGVGFGFVVPGRKYRMHLAGYDTAFLAPRAAGSENMVVAAADAAPESILTADAVTIARSPAIAPRWTSTCDVATAVSTTVVEVASCQKFDLLSSGAISTELRVATSALLGSLECGEADGQIARLSVSVDLEEDVPRVQEVDCGEDAVFSDVPARVSASVYVSAFGADATQAFAGASCDVLTLPSASVTASCSKLSTQGTVRLSFGDLLAAAGATCSPDAITDVLVAVTGESVRHFPPPDCLEPFDHGFEVAPGDDPDRALMSVTVSNDDEQLATFTCHARVLPGAQVPAICDLNEGE